MIKVYRGSKIYGAELKRFLESQGENFLDYKCTDKHLYYGVSNKRVFAYFESELDERYVIKEFDGNLWED
jgi:pyrroloquinoline quinone (PQQ) biosynthesis protein C